MRPEFYGKLTRRNVLSVVAELAKTHLIQPKLNGDRVLLHKLDGYLSAFNRTGTRYGFSIQAISAWQSLPDGTLLDGEGWGGRFYPFDVLTLAGQDLTRTAIESRTDSAKRLCLSTGNPWLWEEPTAAFLLRGLDNLPQWEGIVAKERGSIYEPITRPQNESWQWLKCKW
jgi:ATP-dependent DNA ligase